MLKQVQLWQPSRLVGRDAGHNFGRRSFNDHFTKGCNWLSCSKQLRFSSEFSIGSTVKLSLAVVAILVGGQGCRTNFSRGPSKDHFVQSLVAIGSVVSNKFFQRECKNQKDEIVYNQPNFLHKFPHPFN